MSAKKMPDTDLGRRRHGRVKKAKGVEEKPLQKALKNLKKMEEPIEAVRNWRMKKRKTYI